MDEISVKGVGIRDEEAALECERIQTRITLRQGRLVRVFWMVWVIARVGFWRQRIFERKSYRMQA